MKRSLAIAALIPNRIGKIRVVGQARCEADNFATHTTTAVGTAQNFLATPHHHVIVSSVLYEVGDAKNAALSDTLARVQS